MYSLAELIDLAEKHNPETRVAWDRARAQLSALGVARSELYPTLVAAALSQFYRAQVLFGPQFFVQNVETLQPALDLTYTVFDFGARSGRIDAARAALFAANFAFNDTHRNVIYQVEQAYYQLLNASGQEEAAQASLSNARAVQQAAEERLNNGLATLPDVLEARSATAQADYELQAVLGAKDIARGNLTTALGVSPTSALHVQLNGQVPTEDSVVITVDQAIDRAFAQRPDLMQAVAEIRAANARVEEGRAAYYPAMTVHISSAPQTSYGLQQPLAWAHTSGMVGSLNMSVTWTLLDGGARHSRVAQAEAQVREAESQVDATRDQIADQVWIAYTNLHTAFRQHRASQALLEAASESYAAALESYTYGLRNLLDVTAAQRTLAQARAADVLARVQVLSALADLAFRTADSIQPGAPRP